MPEDYLGQPQQGSGLAESCGLTTQCEQTGVKEEIQSLSYSLAASWTKSLTLHILTNQGISHSWPY